MRATHENAYSKAILSLFLSTLKINKGDEFYLIIDSPYGGNGKFKLFPEFIDTMLSLNLFFRQIKKRIPKKIKIIWEDVFCITMTLH